MDEFPHFCTLCVLRTSFVVKFTFSSGFYHKKLLRNTLFGQAKFYTLCNTPKIFFQSSGTKVGTNCLRDSRLLLISTKSYHVHVNYFCGVYKIEEIKFSLCVDLCTKLL